MGDDLNFKEHCLLIYGLGFTHYPNYDEMNGKDKQMEREFKITNEAWSFMTKNNDAIQLLDSWKILVFCFTVLGVYDGAGPASDVSFLSRSEFRKKTGRSNYNLENFLAEEQAQLMPIEEDGENLDLEEEEGGIRKNHTKDNLKRKSISSPKKKVSNNAKNQRSIENLNDLNSANVVNGVRTINNSPGLSNKNNNDEKIKTPSPNSKNNKGADYNTDNIDKNVDPNKSNLNDVNKTINKSDMNDINKSVNKSVNKSINKSINKSNNKSINKSINKSNNNDNNVDKTIEYNDLNNNIENIDNADNNDNNDNVNIKDIIDQDQDIEEEVHDKTIEYEDINHNNSHAENDIENSENSEKIAKNIVCDIFKDVYGNITTDNNNGDKIADNIADNISNNNNNLSKSKDNSSIQRIEDNNINDKVNENINIDPLQNDNVDGPGSNQGGETEKEINENFKKLINTKNNSAKNFFNNEDELLVEKRSLKSSLSSDRFFSNRFKNPIFENIHDDDPIVKKNTQLNINKNWESLMPTPNDNKLESKVAKFQKVIIGENTITNTNTNININTVANANRNTQITEESNKLENEFKKIFKRMETKAVDISQEARNGELSKQDSKNSKNTEEKQQNTEEKQLSNPIDFGKTESNKINIELNDKDFNSSAQNKFDQDIFKSKDLNISSIEKPIKATGKADSSFLKNISFKSGTNNSRMDKTINKKTNNDIFRIVCPDLNMNIYNYTRRMVKQIKLMFRLFYDNRVAHLSEVKKQIQEEKNKKKMKTTIEPVIKHPDMDKTSDFFKKQALEVIS